MKAKDQTGRTADTIPGKLVSGVGNKAWLFVDGGGELTSRQAAFHAARRTKNMHFEEEHIYHVHTIVEIIKSISFSSRNCYLLQKIRDEWLVYCLIFIVIA